MNTILRFCLKIIRTIGIEIEVISILIISIIAMRWGQDKINNVNEIPVNIIVSIIVIIVLTLSGCGLIYGIILSGTIIFCRAIQFYDKITSIIKTKIEKLDIEEQKVKEEKENIQNRFEIMDV